MKREIGPEGREVEFASITERMRRKNPPPPPKEEVPIFWELCSTLWGLHFPIETVDSTWYTCTCFQPFQFFWGGTAQSSEDLLLHLRFPFLSLQFLCSARPLLHLLLACKNDHYNPSPPLYISRLVHFPPPPSVEEETGAEMSLLFRKGLKEKP